MKLPKSFGQRRKPRLLILRRVVGESMLPTLRPGRVVLATALHRGLHKDDVVIINHRGIDKVKRIHQINQGRLFVLGDNQGRSTDSHTFGWLDSESVVGKVIWPRV